MFKKTFLFSAVTALVAMMSVATASALLDTWNRTNPLLDYVSQEMGMYDTSYDSLTELDCRGCHGDNLKDRHHYSPLGLASQCDACHELISEPPGVIPIRDCTTSGCHSWDDVYLNGWHHKTDLSAAENCVICHNPNLVGRITPFVSFRDYPPSVVTPTPFMCENCHWDQAVVPAAPGFDPVASPPNDAGHPSTYHHGEMCLPTCYHEYGAEILANHDTHHMGSTGNVASDCSACHPVDPNDPSYDPDDPELIRHCEICHDVSSLHAIYPHVGPVGTGGEIAGYGWEAVGFHTANPSEDRPSTYLSFTGDDACFGCHGDNVPRHACVFDWIPFVKIKPQGIVPAAGQATTLVELTGEHFVDIYRDDGKSVQFKRRPDGDIWIDMPIHSRTENKIVFDIPCQTLMPGNYWVRVHDRFRNSNQVVFTFTEDGCGCPGASPRSGPCKTVVRLQDSCTNFGPSQDTISSPGANDGIYRVLEVVSSQGVYTALNIRRWNQTQVKFNFKDFYEDLEPRNYLQDIGETVFSICGGMGLEMYSVYVRSVFYEDTDSSGNFSAGDTITQTEMTSPFYFQLTDEPGITALKPNQRAKGSRIRILGVNFGDNQAASEIRIGTRKQYNTDPLAKGLVMDRVKLWSDNKIVVRLRAKDAWQGTNKYIWVVKDGKASNFKKVEILAPAP